MRLRRLFPMQRSLKKPLLLLVGVLAFFLLFSVFGAAVNAQVQDPQTTNFGLNQAAGWGLPTVNLVTFIGRIVQILLGLLGIVAVLLMMYGGFVWMTAEGDPAKVEKAKKIIYNTIIGLIIIFSAFAIVQFVIMSLRGIGGAGGPSGPVLPGSPSDISRSAIGAGPIEAVYPAPNQLDVNIDTWIAVTFKMEMNTADIISADCTGGICKMTDKIEICLASATSGACLADPGFTIADYASTTVSTTDNRTYVFMPNNLLGLADGIKRKFKVSLKGSITTADGRKVLERYTDRFGYGFKWMFETNGRLDLNPPQIIYGGVIPAPDNLPDIYSAGSAPSSTQFIFHTTDTDILLKQNTSYTQPVTTTASAPPAILEGSYGVQLGSGTVTVSIGSSNGVVTTNWPNGNSYTSNYTEGETTIINLGGSSGLTFKIPVGDYRGSAWSFTVTQQTEGDYIKIFEDSVEKATYYFEAGVTTNTAGMIDKILASSSSIFEACGVSNCVRTKATGDAGKKYFIKYFVKNTVVAVDEAIEKISGQGQTTKRQKQDMNDIPRNQIFQIVFSEAINPLAVNSSNIKVLFSSNTTSSLDAVISNTQLTLSNQYRTLEIMPPDEDKYKCGKNACGDDVYCWPVNSLIDADQDGVVDTDKSNNFNSLYTQYQVSLIAADLKICQGGKETWCTGWDGDCVSGTRCQSNTDNTAYYPKANPSVLNGLMDMSGNSFNGNFSTTTYSSGTYTQIVGSSQGGSLYEHSSTTGGSGVIAYILNLRNWTATSSEATTTYGDSASWKFWMSDEVDIQSPLISNIYPQGDQTVVNFSTPVSTTFDRNMRSATLKPGWNYGATAKSRAQRYIILSTLNKTANPVGYWISNSEIDNNADALAEYSIAFTQHNRFDRDIKYGPLYGSGLQSLRQNCFLPGAGPRDAGGYTCEYDQSNNRSSTCVTIDNANPASFAYATCDEIMMDNPTDRGAVTCGVNPSGAVKDPQDEVCKVLYYDYKDRNSTSTTSTNQAGSWVITKDYPNIIETSTGATGCCFGRCVNSTTGRIINR